MRPAHAVSMKPGSWALETEIGYERLGVEPEVEEYLMSGADRPARDRTGRSAAIRGPAGENYLLDLELRCST